MNARERREKALEALGVDASAPVPNIRHGRGKCVFPAAMSSGTRLKCARKRAYWSCEKKTRYRSQDEAKRVADKVKHLRGTNLRIYYCEHCRGYHLTKQARGGKDFA